MSHTRRKFISAVVLLMAGLSSGAVVQAQGLSPAPYTQESLEGDYAVVGTFGDHVAQSQEVYMIDGKGNLSAVALLNEPDANGNRVLASVTVLGTYTVNADGTGLLVLTLTLPNGGGTATVTQDLLVTKAELSGRKKVATEWVSMQREPAVAAAGATGTFATFVATRRPGP